MSELDHLRAAQRSVFRLSFGEPLETQFRNTHRLRYRYPRILLFVIAAVAFSAAPLYQQLLWQPSAAVAPLLALLEFGLVVPVALLAAITTALSTRRSALVQAIQSVGVLVFWGGVVALRYLSLQGELRYPSEMPGVVIVAVAIFGGFSCRRVIPAALLFIAFSIWQEFSLDPVLASAGESALSLGYLAVIAVAGAYVHELLSRLTWLNGRQAQVQGCTDSLTGLPTRDAFNRLLPRLLEQARQAQRSLAIALLDVDHFKHINDSHGHLFGDRVLRLVGRELLRPGEPGEQLRARYGGEEFVVVWYDITPAQLHRAIEQILERIRQINVLGPDGESALRLTASVGATWLVPGPRTLPEILLHQADLRLYAAKAAGRDCARLEISATLAAAGAGR